MPEPDGRRQQTDFAGGGEMRTAPGPSPNGWWYYFDDQGYMATGWLCLDGLWYYLDRENGDLYVNCWTPDHYWVGPDGVYVPGK